MKKRIILSLSVLSLMAGSVLSQLIQANRDEYFLGANEAISANVLSNDIYSESEQYALAFDGNDEVSYSGENIIDKYPFTVVVWMKSTGLNKQVAVYIGDENSSIDGFSIGVNLGIAELSAWHQGEFLTKRSILGYSSVNDNQWHQIAGVFLSDSTRRLYVDGELESEEEFKVQTLSSTMNKISVGIRGDLSPNDGLYGSVDEVQLIADSLDADELKTLFTNESCKIQSYDKVLIWDFNDVSNGVVNDLSGNSNNGLINGATTIEKNSELKVEIISAPLYGISLEASNLGIEYVPALDFYGSDSLQYALSTNECKIDSAYVVFHVGVTSNELIEQDDFIVPNPLPLEINVPKSISSVSVFSMKGVKLLTYNNGKMNLSALKKGSYLFQVLKSGISEVHLVVKE